MMDIPPPPPQDNDEQPILVTSPLRPVRHTFAGAGATTTTTPHQFRPPALSPQDMVRQFDDNGERQTRSVPSSPMQLGASLRDRGGDDEELSVFQLERGPVERQRYTFTNMAQRRTDLQNRLHSNNTTSSPSVPAPPIEVPIPMQEVLAQRHARWAINVPTTNEHLLQVMMNVQNPFEHRAVTLMDADQISQTVESLYFSGNTLLDALAFMPHRSQDCVVVCGVARCGQTPVLHLLDMLKRGEATKATNFINNVQWLEGLVNNIDGKRHVASSSVTSFGTSVERLLVKSYTPIASFVEKNRQPMPGKSTCKLVCVVRHPHHLRQSWFHHVRHVFHAYLPNQPFLFQLDDFAKQPLGNPRTVGSSAEATDYEDYLGDVLRTFQKYPGMIQIVFFEDLIAKPTEVVRELAQFTKWSYDEVNMDRYAGLYEEIAAQIKVPLRPNPKYLKISNFHLQDQWDNRLRRRFGNVDKYETFYKLVTSKTYPFMKISKVQRVSRRLSLSAAPTGTSGRELLYDVDKDDTASIPIAEIMEPRVSSLQQQVPNEGGGKSPLRGAFQRLWGSSSPSFRTRKGSKESLGTRPMSMSTSAIQLTAKEEEDLLTRIRRERRVLKVEAINHSEVTEVEGMVAVADMVVGGGNGRE